MDASVRNRLVLSLAGGLLLAAAAVAIASRRATSVHAAGRAEALAESTDAATEPDGDEDDAALFAVMERLERRAAAAANRARESVVTLEYTEAGAPDDERSAAVGVVVDGRRGEVMAVRIASPRSTPIVARDAFGRRLLARWIAEDPETGLTLLEIPPGVLRSIPPAAAGPALGSRVFVVGNPFGLGHSISRGEIAGLDRSLKIRDRQIHGLIQVRSPISPGDTGAVVVNDRGQWLGVIRGVDAHAAGQPGGHDLGFAIPADDAHWIGGQLRDRGRVDRAYLGIRLAPEAGDPTTPEGAPLREILPDSPAARAGLLAGERVVSFDGRPVRSASDLTQRLDLTPAEKFVRLEVVRDVPGPQSPSLRRGVWIRAGRRPEPAALAERKPSASPVITPTSAVAPPRSAAADRLDQIERRLERLERAQPSASPAPNAP